MKEQGAAANCSTCTAEHSSSSTERPWVNGTTRCLHANPQQPHPPRSEKQRIEHSSYTNGGSPDQRLPTPFRCAQPHEGSGGSCQRRCRPRSVTAILTVQPQQFRPASQPDISHNEMDKMESLKTMTKLLGSLARDCHQKPGPGKAFRCTLN